MDKVFSVKLFLSQEKRVIDLKMIVTGLCQDDAAVKLDMHVGDAVTIDGIKMYRPVDDDSILLMIIEATEEECSNPKIEYYETYVMPYVRQYWVEINAK